MTTTSVPPKQPASAVERRAQRIVQAVAMDAGVSPRELAWARKVSSLYAHRLLAIVLCLRTYGINRDALAESFNVSPGLLRNCNPELLRYCREHPATAEHFAHICKLLGTQPPHPFSEVFWPGPTIEDIWQRVARRAGVPVHLLQHPGPGRSAQVRRLGPYRALAIDLCLRIPEVHPGRLRQKLGILGGYPSSLLRRIPALYAAHYGVQQLDIELSRRFGLEPRLEWR